MSLIRNGAVAEDRYVTIVDGDAIPDTVPVLVPAVRYLADAAEFAGRSAPAGVIWPNDRRISELAPYLDRISLIVLNFPSFRDGRAYSQARQLREQYGYRGELRATGDILRDQFLFLLRAGFDSFDVRKEADTAAFAEAVSRYSVFYQPTGDGRATARTQRLARLPGKATAESIRLPTPPADVLNRALEHATPEEILAEAIRTVPRGRLALVSSFGIESAILLQLVAKLDRTLPVIFLDTGWLFGETLAYRDQLVEMLRLTDVRSIIPRVDEVAAQDPEADLWSRNPAACCALRKVAPLAGALSGFNAWITGRKRFQGGARANIPIVENDGTRLKFNPLARLAPKDIASLFRNAALPQHPLSALGFTSVGCLPCSSPARQGEGAREGRWRGQGRTECGIHTPASN